MQELIEQIEYSQRLIQGSHMPCPTDGGPSEIVWRVIYGSVATDLTVYHPRIPVIHLPRHGRTQHSFMVQGPRRRSHQTFIKQDIV